MINKEIENVLKLNNEKKYEYFIKKIADYEEVWALKDDDGWATLGDEDNVFFPVWAKKDYSNLCVKEEWIGYTSQKISIQEFVENWIPGLKRDNIRITIMWHNGKGIDVDWDILINDIMAELEKY